MKTVALLTYHRAINYGSVLQAYATKEYIQSIGLDCTLIDYESYGQKYYYSSIIIPQFHKLKFSSSSFHLIAKKILGFNKFSDEKRNIFDTFLKTNFKMTRLIDSRKDLSDFFNVSKFDYYVTGGDQTWNANCCEHIYNKEDSYGTFFYDFVDSGTKISFSSSVGNARIEQILPKKNFLEKYKYISTRELEGASLLKKAVNKNIDVVCDPTFLLDYSEWNNIAKKERLIENDYILLYSLATNKNIDKWHNSINVLAKRKKLKVVFICPFVSKTINDVINMSDCGPEDFLSLFRDASYTVVDSFHGLCFSLIYRKSFALLGNKYYTADIRKKSLLERFGLLNKMVENEEDIIDMNLDCDYENCNSKIDNFISESKRILSSYFDE